MIVSLQFGLGLRNQEVFGLRWSSLALEGLWIMEALSWDGIETLGKTEQSTGRFARAPEILLEDLEQWRTTLHRAGFPADGNEFVVPGNLAGPLYGDTDERTGARHFSINQAKKWHPRCMAPAAAIAAERNVDWSSLRDATPYSLRRGGISARLRGENAQSVADQCGTSLEMLSRHYSYEIDSFTNGRPVTMDEQWRPARAAVARERLPLAA
jgi:integrase